MRAGVSSKPSARTTKACSAAPGSAQPFGPPPSRSCSWPPPSNDDESPPKYLALRGSKPLLGFAQACSSPAVSVVEGAFDVLTLRMWGYPAVAVVGTHARPDIVDQLRVFQRVYLALDQDDAGLEATLRFMDALSPNAIPVALPEGVKDIAELAPRADGRLAFAAALLEAVGASPPAAAP